MLTIICRFWLYDFRKCAPRPCASPSSWRARAGRLSQVCDISIRSREITAISATNDWTWPSRRATSCGSCGGTRRGRAEPLLKPPTDTRCTRIPIYISVPSFFPIALYIPGDTCEVRLPYMPFKAFWLRNLREIFLKAQNFALAILIDISSFFNEKL